MPLPNKTCKFFGNKSLKYVKYALLQWKNRHFSCLFVCLFVCLDFTSFSTLLVKLGCSRYLIQKQCVFALTVNVCISLISKEKVNHCWVSANGSNPWLSSPKVNTLTQSNSDWLIPLVKYFKIKLKLNLSPNNYINY